MAQVLKPSARLNEQVSAVLSEHLCSAAHSGHVVYIYTYDIAYDLARRPLDQLLGQPVAQFTVDASKRSPKQLVFYSPQMVRLPPLERIGPQGALRLERTVKILPVGALSITVRV